MHRIIGRAAGALLCRAREPQGLALGAAEAAARSFSTASSSTSEDGGLSVFRRERAGSIASMKLRRDGKVPGIVFDQYGSEKILVWMQDKDIMKQLKTYTSAGFCSRIVDLELKKEDGTVDEKIQALPKMIHRNAVTDIIENVTFMRASPEAIVKVNVPVRLSGIDACPGIRKGGTLNFIRRTVPIVSPASALPPSIQLDLSKLEIGGKIALEAVPLPKGASLRIQDPSLLVLKIMGRVARGAADAAADAAVASAAAASSAAAAPAGGAKAAAGAAPAAGKAAAPAAGGDKKPAAPAGGAAKK